MISGRLFSTPLTLTPGRLRSIYTAYSGYCCFHPYCCIQNRPLLLPIVVTPYRLCIYYFIMFGWRRFGVKIHYFVFTIGYIPSHWKRFNWLHFLRPVIHISHETFSKSTTLHWNECWVKLFFPTTPRGLGVGGAVSACVTTRGRSQSLKARRSCLEPDRARYSNRTHFI